ncbi:MAG: 5-methyltetrahydropteroyltriglutamate--homocysteine S-methyltransferase [Chlorobium sp.]|uniref:5-methyltetrahydropteroyltriglutamate-- homocysteine S-methyltransferase n=1 Tax=Chlorobium sp. TaxID=1095 RepID=UPI0025C50616|nr:5-methyltetrahydropteroyltriglutamate--homocysteine S-methyltransferase [Chlorobium sp.]MCF8215874.1 5-methyltetrahydropteroyltriglutamate--homocysteine S-methyltransferase [Chlorobium sp.]MCF8270772.1 5-methyltetrahydropteroyltriglutamate--homocysteine S-methyltransferase [Chlorobium sp.]MCF8287084.1 5-methyltetrahydropteroyltriglutamate--homocysteine S-methyltransferase [Chlorobium sp.]MCF8290741.1 5-methyltetrahydropteroyltriglutamate--homocysteine S-methyltransferase [Chlorobium sp.]MCF
MLTHTLGYPRIGASRGMKKACENYWAGRLDEASLRRAALDEKHFRWKVQLDAGMDLVACNDFSLYDHVQDMNGMVGAVPERYEPLRQHLSDLDLYFAMCRGYQQSGFDVTAMEMTKWFDTNYHYLVPEFTSAQRFCYASRKAVEEFLEARAFGVADPKTVMIGPVSFLLLGREKGDGFHRLDLIERLLPVYVAILEDLRYAGCFWLQFDEPFLVTDLDEKTREVYLEVYRYLKQHFPDMHFLLATYFGGLGDNLQTALSLPVDTLHVDAVNGFNELPLLFDELSSGMNLSLGLVDGRNIWLNRVDESLGILGLAVKSLGKERLMVSSSCSLLHVPYDLDLEPEGGPLPDLVKPWLAFARQKLGEIRSLADLMQDDVSDESFHALSDHLNRSETRRHSSALRNEAVRSRADAFSGQIVGRQEPFHIRNLIQSELLRLPVLPATMIGSLPQTADLRLLRKRYRSGEVARDAYESGVRKMIADAILWQESVGLDVLVHGEFERTDMVEYFAEHLEGIAFTANGWVQSYGTRAVKPPVIYGDVSRKFPITLGWTVFAQSLTHKPVKGMLTGPVTILKWSFVRDDQPLHETAMQVALALRDEVLDLELAGIGIIQIDEPGIREGLPLKKAGRPDYLKWAVRAFALCSGGVAPATQIHTHMCYADYGDILDALVRMDADVLTIETARSDMRVLADFAACDYPNHIGPGIYDIHSPRVPSVKEMHALLIRALQYLRPEQIWVNPDCGLKTRNRDEVRLAIANMVKAAKKLRRHLPSYELIRTGR